MSKPVVMVAKKTTLYIYIQCIVSYPEWSDSHLNFKIHIHMQREVNSISYSHLLALRPSASSEGNMGRAGEGDLIYRGTVNE